jgi:hypothetical protein
MPARKAAGSAALGDEIIDAHPLPPGVMQQARHFLHVPLARFPPERDLHDGLFGDAGHREQDGQFRMTLVRNASGRFSSTVSISSTAIVNISQCGGGSGTGSAKWLEIVTPNLGRASLILPSCIRTCSTDALSTAGRWITDTLLEAAAVAEGEGMAHRRARACGASRAATDPWRSGCRPPWGGSG